MKTAAMPMESHSYRLPSGARAVRAVLPETRNPVLALPSAARLAALPPEARVVLRDLLGELATDARERAEKSWRTHKAPMAAYWKAVSVYARHLSRVLRAASSRPPTSEGTPMSHIQQCPKCAGNIVTPAYEGDGDYPVEPMCKCPRRTPEET